MKTVIEKQEAMENVATVKINENTSWRHFKTGRQLFTEEITISNDTQEDENPILEKHRKHLSVDFDDKGRSDKLYLRSVGSYGRELKKEPPTEAEQEALVTLIEDARRAKLFKKRSVEVRVKDDSFALKFDKLGDRPSVDIPKDSTYIPDRVTTDLSGNLELVYTRKTLGLEEESKADEGE